MMIIEELHCGCRVSNKTAQSSLPGVQLQTGLDQPNGISGCDGGEPCEVQRSTKVQTDAETLGNTSSYHPHEILYTKKDSEKALY